MVEVEFRSLPKDMQARFFHISELIEGYGIEHAGMPHVRHLEGKLWEMRAKGKAGISRGIYEAISGRRVVILWIFVKKTEKTPRAENCFGSGSDEGVVIMGKKIREIKNELLADEGFRREYDALEEEFSIAAQLIEARTKANLTQEQVARRMGTTQSVVARLESGHPLPSLRSLRRYASAVGSKVEIRLVRE